MNLLLDTHVFIWLMEAPKKVPAVVLEACENPNNRLILSIASVWEMQIKLGIGKLRLKRAFKEIVEEQQRDNNLEILPIKLIHLWALPDLPPKHADPFDRLLVAQANTEDMHLISADRVFSRYPVKLLWRA